MLIGLTIRDVVLIEALDLAMGEGMTALTGETGAGKSIVLDALGLATGARAEAGLVRRGATQASAAAVFAPGPDHPVWVYLEEKGLPADPSEDLVLRRQLSADGRSRAFVNDQAAGVAVLREIGAMLLEVHGQHETVGLLDPKTHRALLDSFGDCGKALDATAAAWSGLRIARAQVEALADRAARSAAETEDLTARLAELDRLDPREGEEAALAEERALLSAGEKTIADVAAARDALGGPVRTPAPCAAWPRPPPPSSAPWSRPTRRSRPWTRPSTPSTSNPTGWKRPRSGCSPCAAWPASWAPPPTNFQVCG
jgi:DNA repair protein RecN (Recombination protein N)